MKNNIHSILELKILVKKLLKKGYKKFLLYGDLGVGKTEFTKQLCLLLNIKNISSPTYTYINIYNNFFLHGDFYRIENKEDFINLGIIEEIENYEYVVIEWAKFEKFYIEKDFIKIYIKKLKNNHREFYIKI